MKFIIIEKTIINADKILYIDEEDNAFIVHLDSGDDLTIVREFETYDDIITKLCS